MAVAVALAAGPAAVAPGAVAGWSQAGYGPGNRYDNPMETVLTPSTVGGLRPQWSVAPAGAECELLQPVHPVVSDGRLFHIGVDGALDAYDADTGALRWRHAPGVDGDWCYGGTAVLAVSHGLLLVGWTGCGEPHDCYGALLAFDAATGRARWTAEGSAGVREMVVLSDVVVTSEWSMSCDDVCDESFAVRAYRIADGAYRWGREDMQTAGVAARARVLLSSPYGGGAAAVSAADGSTLWTVGQPWWPLAASPGGDSFYARSADGHLARIDAGTGALAWSVADAAGALAVADTSLYVNRDGGLTARSATTGARIWNRPVSKHLGQPIVAGRLIYVGNTAGGLLVLDKRTGTSIGTRIPRTPFVGNPVVVDGHLYLTSTSGLDSYSL